MSNVTNQKQVSGKRFLDIHERPSVYRPFSEDNFVTLAKLKHKMSKPDWAGSEKKRLQRIGNLVTVELKATKSKKVLRIKPRQAAQGGSK